MLRQIDDVFWSFFAMQVSGDPEVRAQAALRIMGARSGSALAGSRAMPSIAMPMHLALDSAPYAVSKDASPAPFALLKVFEADAQPFVDFTSVIAASRQAADLHLAPTLLDADESTGALLYDWLPSSDWRPALRHDLDDEATLSTILDAKRSWHRSTRLAVTRSPFETISSYLEMMEGMPAPGGGLLSDLGSVRGLRQWIDRFRDCFEAAGYDVGPIHGENTLANVMLGGGGRVQLVDFDRALNADPHYDLASFCVELCSFGQDVDEVTALYLGAADAKVAARVRLYMIVDDFLWGCWALLEHCMSPRSGSVEFYKYAQNRLLRCKYWIASWDVAALLRQV